jgi:hypothetical protein
MESPFVLPGIAIDGKYEGERLVITSTTTHDGDVIRGVWIVEGDGEDAEAMFICDVIGEEEYIRLYKFFEPLSDGDVEL